MSLELRTASAPVSRRAAVGSPPVGPVDRIVTAFVATVVAIAVVLNLAQIVIAADGDVTAIRLIVAVAVGLGWGLSVAYRRMRRTTFAILASAIAATVIMAGLLALTVPTSA